MTIISEILNILNNVALSYEDKLSKLREVRDHRRGNNLITIKIIIRIIEEWSLPISNEKFDNGKDIFNCANDKVYENIKMVAAKSKMTLFNASCNELLFYHYHEIELAKQAILSYFNAFLSR